MIGHYLAVALRNLARKPVNTAIKLLALALGLAGLLTAHVIGDYYRQADRQWAKADRTYLVIQETELTSGGWDSSTDQRGSPAIAPFLRIEIPELEEVARMNVVSMPLRRPGEEQAMYGAGLDPEFLDIFPLEMTAGEARLEAPRTAVVSESAATALFGDESPVGQTLVMNGAMDVTITGVFRDLPEDSHLGAAGQKDLRVLYSLATWDDAVVAATPGAWRPSEQEIFDITGFVTYAVLPADGSLTRSAFQRRLDDMAQRRVPDATLETRFRAEPLLGLAETRFNRSIGLPAGLSVVTALYILGALTLGIGCVNFANLAAAEAATRAPEIGVRKTMGATRRQVAAQALVESALVVGVALALVAPLSAVIAQAISSRFFVPIPMPTRIEYWAGVILLAAMAAVAAGVYPALSVASLRPVFALRMRGLRGSGSATRTLLIGAQFAAAGLLLTLVLVMLQQNAGLRRIMLQPDEDPVVTVAMPGVRAQDFQSELDRMENFRSMLVANPTIRGVTFAQMTPFYNQTYMVSEFSQSLDPGARRFAGNARRVHYDYFETMRIPVLAGRVFTRDGDNVRKAVIDEETARIMGYTPQEAIGQPIYRTASRELASTEDEAAAPEHIIIGVVAREPLEFIAEGPANYIYVNEPATASMALVRLAKEDVAGGLEDLRRVWGQLSPGGEATPQFLDEAFEWRFRTFGMITFVFAALSAIAAAIAAMGLFGLASFVVQRRLRELGVRKTLGASGPRVLGMMLWDFSKPVIVANLIAWPLAFLAARFYLNLFVTRIELTPLPFLMALGVSLLVAWIAVSAHAIRAAAVKPALVLKTE